MSKFMSNFMNRKQRSVEIKDSVPPIEIVEQDLNEIGLPEEETIESYLKELLNTQNLKQKIHFFDRECTSSQVIQFYNKSICIDDQAAAAINSGTRVQDNCFEWKKGKRIRLRTEDCYALYTFLKNKKRTDKEWETKTVNYLKKKENVKVLKFEREQNSSSFELYHKETGERIEKVGLVIHPTCPWLCASPDGFCVVSKILIKMKYFSDTKNGGLTAVMRNLSYLNCDSDASGNQVYKLKKKHALYAELQLNMCLLNCLDCNLILFDTNEKSFRKVEVTYDSAFVLEILSSLKEIYMRYFLNFIFENMLTDADKQNFK